MKIVWDEPKRQTNLTTHGLDLADAELFDWDGAVVVRGHNRAGGRSRFRAIGRLGNDLVTIVFSPLGTEAVFCDQHAAGKSGRKEALWRSVSQNCASSLTQRRRASKPESL